MKPLFAIIALLFATSASAGEQKSQDQIRSDLEALSNYCAVDDDERILRRHECRRLARAAIAKLETFEGIELGDRNANVVPAVAKN